MRIVTAALGWGVAGVLAGVLLFAEDNGSPLGSTTTEPSALESAEPVDPVGLSRENERTRLADSIDVVTGTISGDLYIAAVGNRGQGPVHLLVPAPVGLCDSDGTVFETEASPVWMVECSSGEELAIFAIGVFEGRAVIALDIFCASDGRPITSARDATTGELRIAVPGSLGGTFSLVHSGNGYGAFGTGTVVPEACDISYRF